MRKLTFVLTAGGATLAISAGMFVLGCDSSPGQVGAKAQTSGGGPGISIKTDGSPPGTPGANGSDAIPAPAPTPGANCGGQSSDTSRAPADVLLVLDRSGSMDWSTAKDNQTCGSRSPGCTARWPALTDAVKETLDSTAGSISWGLKLFSSPSGSSCGVDPGVDVPIAADSVPKIETKMTQVKPGNSTPTAQAIAAATNYLKTVQDGNNRVILLATDGEPNCLPGSKDNSTPNVEGTIAAIAAAKAAGFPVYVIGIGPNVPNLNEFAKAGGTGTHFPTDTPEALTAAFATISKAVATCSFTIIEPPKDPDNVAVYLGGELVAKDPANGWSYGASNNVVELKGASCAAITSGAKSKVQILFACPGAPPPATFPIL